jgi:hypothetical protein
MKVAITLHTDNPNSEYVQSITVHNVQFKTYPCDERSEEEFIKQLGNALCNRADEMAFGFLMGDPDPAHIMTPHGRAECIHEPKFLINNTRCKHCHTPLVWIPKDRKYGVKNNTGEQQ